VTEATTTPVPIVGLTPLGESDADSCEGEFCAIPDHHMQTVVNRRVDQDEI